MPQTLPWRRRPLPPTPTDSGTTLGLATPKANTKDNDDAAVAVERLARGIHLRRAAAQDKAIAKKPAAKTVALRRPAAAEGPQPQRAAGVKDAQGRPLMMPIGSPKNQPQTAQHKVCKVSVVWFKRAWLGTLDSPGK